MNPPETAPSHSEPRPGTQADPRAGISGCWSSTGVYGDGSCSELQKVIHCRNCPVYSAAALKLIDRPLPPNYRAEWTRHFAKERRSPEAGDASVILFRIQNDWLALPTQCFQEVAEARSIHSLPHRRTGFVLGLANVRGELVVCISIGHLLQIEETPSLAELRLNYQRLLVVQSENNRLAFPVDEVHGPHRFQPQGQTSVPAASLGQRSQLVQDLLPWQEHTAGLLDTDQLFSTCHRLLA